MQHVAEAKLKVLIAIQLSKTGRVDLSGREQAAFLLACPSLE